MCIGIKINRKNQKVFSLYKYVKILPKKNFNIKNSQKSSKIITFGGFFLYSKFSFEFKYVSNSILEKKWVACFMKIKRIDQNMMIKYCEVSTRPRDVVTGPERVWKLGHVS